MSSDQVFDTQVLSKLFQMKTICHNLERHLDLELRDNAIGSILVQYAKELGNGIDAVYNMLYSETPYIHKENHHG